MTERPLGDLLEVVIDHRGKTPKKLGGTDFTDAGVPVVSAIHIKNGRINWEERLRFAPQWMFEKWMPVRLKKGDVLLTSEAPLGEVAQVETDEPLVLSQRLFALRGKPGLLDSTYLRYFLQSSEGQRRLLARASGTTVFGIRQAELVKVLVPVQPIDEQRRIAGVLGALDDLIDTNTRIAHEADSCAAAWWESVLHGESRDVPVGTLATVVLGGTPSRSNPSFWGGTVPWINSGEANKFRILHASEMITEEGLVRSSTKMMPAGATVVAITGATLGQVSRLGISACGNQSLVGVFTQDEATNDHLFFAIRNAIPGLVASATGGAQQHINKGNVEELLVSSPNPELLRSWHEIARPLLDASSEMLREADELARVRDELLPLLMSGRISADEAWEAAS